MISIYLAFLASAFAGEKIITASTLGDKMMVEHLRNDSGREVLRVRQVAVNGDKQIVELNLAKHEVLANDEGFRCENGRDEIVYAVISKKRAKENDIFPVERAWIADTDKVKFERVTAISKVKCYWAPDGESSYPYK